MRLVDRDQRDLPAGQPLQRARRQQPLRRHIEQVEPAVLERAGRLRRGDRVDLRMQRRRRDAELAQARHLVVHERDQRRDHDGGARRGTAPAPGSRGSCRRRSASARARRRRRRRARRPAPAARGTRGSRIRGAAPASGVSVMARSGSRRGGSPCRGRRRSPAAARACTSDRGTPSRDQRVGDELCADAGLDLVGFRRARRVGVAGDGHDRSRQRPRRLPRPSRRPAPWRDRVRSVPAGTAPRNRSVDPGPGRSCNQPATRVRRPESPCEPWPDPAVRAFGGSTRRGHRPAAAQAPDPVQPLHPGQPVHDQDHRPPAGHPVQRLEEAALRRRRPARSRARPGSGSAPARAGSRASASRRPCPPDSPAPPAPSQVSSPSGNPRTTSSQARLVQRPPQLGLGRRRAGRAAGWRGSCPRTAWSLATARRSARARQPTAIRRTSTPPSVTRPACGASNRSARAARVDLPAPDGPRIATRAPSGISSETSCSTGPRPG